MADSKTRTRPETIADEVRRTQDEIGETVDRLEEKMNPRDISREVLGEDGTDVAREALEVTRTNPIPVAMIAIGLIWLIASSNSPAIRRLTGKITGKSGGMDLRSRSEEPAPIGPSIPAELDERENDMDLRPRSAEPAPIGPPPARGTEFDRRR